MPDLTTSADTKKVSVPSGLGRSFAEILNDKNQVNNSERAISLEGLLGAVEHGSTQDVSQHNSNYVLNNILDSGNFEFAIVVSRSLSSGDIGLTSKILNTLKNNTLLRFEVLGRLWEGLDIDLPNIKSYEQEIANKNILFKFMSTDSSMYGVALMVEGLPAENCKELISTVIEKIPASSSDL